MNTIHGRSIFQNALPCSAVDSLLEYLDFSDKNVLCRVDRCWNNYLLGHRKGPEFNIVGGYHPSLIPVAFTKSSEWNEKENSKILDKRFRKDFDCPYVCTFSTSLDFLTSSNLWKPIDTFKQRFINRLTLPTEKYPKKTLRCDWEILPSDALERVIEYLKPSKEMTSLSQVNRSMQQNFRGINSSSAGMYIPSLIPFACRKQLEHRNSSDNALMLSEFDWVEMLYERFKIPFNIWPEVQHLNLSGTNIDNRSLQLILQKLPNLKSLSLRQISTITMLDSLKGLSYLSVLDLSDCSEICDLEPLSGLNHLQFLDLSRCYKISCLGALSYIPSLTRLNISGTQISSLASLVPLISLTRLILNECHQLRSEEFVYLENLQALEFFSTDSELHDADFRNIIKLSSLKTLILLNCSHVTNFGLRNLSNLKNLRFLKLENARNLTDEGFTFLSRIILLEQLVVYNSFQITDLGLMHLMKLSELRQLFLSEGTQIQQSELIRVVFGRGIRICYY